MAETSNIAWTDASWNPWRGCHKVSEACANCYMYRDAKRYGHDPNIVVRSKTTFNDPLKWKDARKIFTCSWSDWFIEEADQWRDEAWDIIRRTPQHTYQILTKRPERILRNLPRDWYLKDAWRHVWIGSTIEKDGYTERFSDVYRAEPIVRFISVEPMLGSFKNFDWFGIDWVICGCESGPNARETKIEWVRDLRDQCQSAGVPFFLKQLMVSGKLVTTPELDGRTWTEFPRCATKAREVLRAPSNSKERGSHE